MSDVSCLLNQLTWFLYCDYDQVEAVDHMANNSLEYIATNADYHKEFNTGDLIWDTKG